MDDPVLLRHIIERFERRWALQNPLGLGRTYKSLTPPLEMEPSIPLPPSDLAPHVPLPRLTA
jgi:hypothetical protein